LKICNCLYALRAAAETVVHLHQAPGRAPNQRSFRDILKRI
jgi:hypothetical protein